MNLVRIVFYKPNDWVGHMASYLLWAYDKPHPSWCHVGLQINSIVYHMTFAGLVIESAEFDKRPIARTYEYQVEYVDDLLNAIAVVCSCRYRMRWWMLLPLALHIKVPNCVDWVRCVYGDNDNRILAPYELYLELDKVIEQWYNVNTNQ